MSYSINGICQSIEEFEIQQNSYDFIVAVSSLEHIESHNSFIRKLFEIKDGLRENGIVCIILNTSISESNAETNESLEPQFELNYPTEILQAFLNEAFCGWDVLVSSVVAQEYNIPRATCTSHLDTKVVTYVARNVSTVQTFLSHP